jgi:hypothetical protein
MRGGTLTTLVSLLALFILKGSTVCAQPNIYGKTFVTTAVHRTARYAVTCAAGRTGASAAVGAANHAAAGGAIGEVAYLRTVMRALRSPLETLNSLAKLANQYIGVVNGWASNLFNALPAGLQFVLVPSANPYILGLYYTAVLLGLLYAYRTWAAHDPTPTSTASHPTAAQHHHDGGASSAGGWAKKAIGVFVAAGYLSSKPALHEAVIARAFVPTPTGGFIPLPATCPAVPYYGTMLFETAQHGSPMLFDDVTAPATLDIVSVDVPYATCPFNFSPPPPPLLLLLPPVPSTALAAGPGTAGRWGMSTCRGSSSRRWALCR